MSQADCRRRHERPHRRDASTRSSPASRRSGTFVRVLTPHVEGLLASGQQGVDVGDKLRVRLVRTDVERGFIDFARAGSPV